MKALVLAAGEGTRLRPHTSDRPKPMVEIAGEPAIAYALTWLRHHGIRDVAINLHHHVDVLRRYVGTGRRFGVQVTYSVEPELLGTAGALRPLQRFFTGEDSFVVLYGDVLTDLELRPVLAGHASSGADATLVLTEVDDPTRAGIVAFDGAHWVTRLEEKPAANAVFSRWANAGVYVCGPKVLEHVAPEGPQDFVRELFPAMLGAGCRLQAFPTEARVVDYGSPERLRLAVEAAEAGAFTFVDAGGMC